MKIQVHATVIEGYSDKPTGRLSESIVMDYDLPAVPRKDDYIGTAYGDQPVDWVWWGRDGSVTVHIKTIYTLAENLDYVLGVLKKGAPIEDKVS
jgi:hypothetical protein